MQSIIVGEIPQAGMALPLKTAFKHRNIPNIVVRIRANGVSGSMGVFCGEYITGACVTSTGETGRAALDTLMSLKEGIYELLDAGHGLPSELEQALIVEIAQLLGERWQPAETQARSKVSSAGPLPSFDTVSSDPLQSVFGRQMETPTTLPRVGVLALDHPVTEDFRRLKDWSETKGTLKLMACALILTMLALVVMLFGQESWQFIMQMMHPRA